MVATLNSIKGKKNFDSRRVPQPTLQTDTPMLCVKAPVQSTISVVVSMYSHNFSNFSFQDGNSRRRLFLRWRVQKLDFSTAPATEQTSVLLQALSRSPESPLLQAVTFTRSMSNKETSLCQIWYKSSLCRGRCPFANLFSALLSDLRSGAGYF